MFRLAITLLTATTFVAHAILGCCWHHEHSHEVGGLEQAARPQTIAHKGHAHGCHSHKTHVNDGHSGDHDSSVPHSDECEGKCVFVTTQETATASSQFLVSGLNFEFAIVFADDHLLPNAGLSAFLAIGGALPDFAAPCCALSQVWLI